MTMGVALVLAIVFVRLLMIDPIRLGFNETKISQ
jgi:hypothetical protein